MPVPMSPVMQAEPCFVDQDGLEISVIEQKDNKLDQLNNSAESDPEILKFVFGENSPELKQLQYRKSSFDLYALPQKSWWKAVSEDGVSDSEICEKMSSMQ